VGWERLKYANAATTAADNSFTLQNWVVNGTFNLTPSDTIGVGYSKTAGRKDCGVGVAATCGSQTGAKLMAVSIDHAFTKRTAVYAYWSKLDNNSAANYNYISDSRETNQAAGAGAGYAAGSDSKNFNIGVKHSF
jgi:predicted porin